MRDSAIYRPISDSGHGLLREHTLYMLTCQIKLSQVVIRSNNVLHELLYGYYACRNFAFKGITNVLFHTCFRRYTVRYTWTGIPGQVYLDRYTWTDMSIRQAFFLRLFGSTRYYHFKYYYHFTILPKVTGRHSSRVVSATVSEHEIYEVL
jgi:hypothetical protein